MFFKNKVELVQKIEAIIREKWKWEEVIAENNRSMDAEYRHCLEEGISAQPLCTFELGMINEAEEALDSLKTEYQRYASSYVERFKGLPENLMWELAANQNKSSLTPR